MPLGPGHIVKKKLEIGTPRPLTREDLERLKETRNEPVVQRLRDSHHMVARLVAAGLPHDVVARRTGYGYNRVTTLLQDPAFQNLLKHYREVVTEEVKEEVEEYLELATSNMLKAERMVADQLDDADEAGSPIPIRNLLAISRDAADRLGFGKRNTTVNVNVDFAAKLEAALARTARAREATRTIEGSVVASLPPGVEVSAVPASRPHDVAASPPRIARRI